MNIAVLSDIHGNHFALKQVLVDLKRKKVDKIIILGDIVGYYYHPEKVFELLSEWDYIAIKGNHEVILQLIYENKIDTKEVKRKYGSGHEIAIKNLTKSELFYLFNLPQQRELILDDVSFQLNHGAPWDQEEYLYPDTKIEKLLKCNSINHNFVLVGHSHYSFSFDCGNSILINSGSVGQSRKKGGIANWVLIDTNSKSYEINDTLYEIDELLLEINKFDPNNKYLKEVLLRQNN
tara:strand:+ start:26239 stop:26943 length:705 start_codon:yes stop_codon:yes gene_type:complete